jgi:hypothetical protein
MWTMVWWYWLGPTPNLSTRALWQPPVLSGGPGIWDIYDGEWAKEMKIYSIRPRGTSRDLLHAVKSYDVGPSRFTSQPKESVLRIFIALKNPSPWSGSNQQPLGPVASTLTTTPPRQQWQWWYKNICEMYSVITSEEIGNQKTEVKNSCQEGLERKIWGGQSSARTVAPRSK